MRIHGSIAVRALTIIIESGLIQVVRLPHADRAPTNFLGRRFRASDIGKPHIEFDLLALDCFLLHARAFTKLVLFIRISSALNCIL